MKLKQLQDLANVLPEMFASERLADDAEALVALPEGILHMDLLAETATHSVAGKLELHITRNLASWMRSRLTDYKIPKSALRQVELKAQVRGEKLIDTSTRKRLALRIQVDGFISTDERTYERSYRHTQYWNSQLFDGRWLYSGAD